MNKFIILALPRSRTFWLSNFLSYGGNRCGHDIAVECDSIEDFEKKMFWLSGTCETGAMIAWRTLRRRLPDAKIITIRRSKAAVIRSFERLGFDINHEEMDTRDALLDVVEKLPETLSFDYEELSSESSCKRLFEHCLEIKFSPEWWDGLKDCNLQINLHDRLLKLRDNAPRFVKLKAELIADQLANGCEQWLN